MTSAQHPAVALTQELVRIPSENPPTEEQAVADFIAAWMRKLPGVEVEVQEVHPKRPNVIGRLRSANNRPGFAILGHMDTVPVGKGWTQDPFGGQIVDGRLYGRGACDMKAGLAAGMTALAAVAKSGRTPDRNIMVCATVDEEGSHMTGGVNLIERKVLDSETFIIAAEPTNLEVVVAHKGLVWLEVETLGKLAHAGNPQVGVDAIRAAAAFITAFYDLISALPHNHCRLGKAAATFSAIQGGIKTNVVPDRARIEVDVRLPPPMTLADIHQFADAAARKAEQAVPGSTVKFRQFNNDRPPVVADETSELVAALSAAIQAVTGNPPKMTGLPAYTDASVAAALTGNPHGLVFGPGALAQAHTVDEYVPVKQIEQAARTFELTIQKLCFSK